MNQNLSVNEYREQVRNDAVLTARSILSGELDLVSGCRKLAVYRGTLPSEQQHLFIPIVAFESETDIYPIGDARERYEPDYLARLDKQRIEYSEQSKPWVFKACREIIQQLSGGEAALGPR